jgi:hypothetical protein
MDWANEDYVRMYTRETADDLELSWEAIALWRAMMCKFDRAGVIQAKNGWRSVSALTRIPFEVVERAGAELLQDGRVKDAHGGFYAPNFIDAQTASKSDKARQKESRDRRRAHYVVTKRDGSSRNVTDGHEESRGVTNGHEESRDVTLTSAIRHVTLPPVAEALLVPPNDSASSEPPKTRGRRKAPVAPRPADWRPNENHREIAKEQKVDLEFQARRFCLHYDASGKLWKDWDAAFSNWLLGANNFRGGSSKSGETALEVALRIADGGE